MQDSNPLQNGKPFSIVGIGASAGGLEAMTELLQNLSPDTGMAYIYIQHLDRDYESNLAEILSRSTKMMVLTAKNHLSIKPNHLYVIPPDKYISITGEFLKVTSRAPNPALNLPVTFLFLSLAETQRGGSIGIVLSGMASDGALGLKAIKQAGGITYVQDDSAPYESMPKAAIAEGAVDAILSPKEIAKELERISRNRHLYDALPIEDETPEKQEDIEQEDNNEDELSEVLQVLKKYNGVDFTHYKKNTIRRRIIRRMLLHKFETLPEYVQFLKRNETEISNLYNDLLINVTHFFRDPNVSEYLHKSLLPKLLKSKSVNEPLRIWIPACSTGEEAYSLAMILYEVAGENTTVLPVQIFATDLSEIAITKARVGLYSTSDVQLVSAERLNNFFTKVDGHFRVNKVIRDICVFACHNIFKDPPFSRVDIISCCNVLIYLDTVLQKKIMANFHYALNKNGYLVLGHSETVGSSVQLFSQVEKKLKIYQKKNDVASRAMFEMNYNFPAKEPLTPTRPASVKPVKEVSNNLNLEKLVDKVFLNEFSPAAVVVNHDLDILQFRGSTGLYLEPSPGLASLNLLKMARSGLVFELRNVCSKVIKSGEAEKKGGLEINHKGNLHQVSFQVMPLNVNAEEQLLLVIFEEVKLSATPDKKGAYSKDRRVKQLENELLSLRDDMRSIVEEQEAANEELQSANEEIVSSNEELQSINEELETSKEEIESSNEELMTINQELLVRNHQLAEAYDYSEAVISTIRESVLVLDNSLLVKVGNAAFYRTFNTSEKETEGKLIYELSNHDWNIPKLRELLEELVPRNKHFHGMEIKHVFKSVGEKVFLVNCRKIVQAMNQQQIFLLAFEDITEHKQAERLLEEREAWLRNMTNNVPVMIWVASTDKNFIFLNKTWLAFTGRTLAKETGIGWTESLYKDDIEPWLTTYHEAFDKKTPFTIECRIKRYDGEYRWVVNAAVPTFDSSGEFTGYIGSCTEIHDKRMLNEELERMVAERTHALKKINESLERSNSELQQFAYVASHDLQEPLRKIITFSNQLQEKFNNQLPEGSRPYLDKITQASKRMTHLINDLLDFSAVAKPGKHSDTINLNESLQSLLTDLELLIQEKNAKIVAGNLPSIQAHAVQMNQLFYNLLGNALKFSSKDKPQVITISCRMLAKMEVENRPRLNKALTYYEILIKDEGIGFPQEYAEQIFIIFQRLNERHHYSGTGIGLALCKKIVENHGGEIFARSEENAGARFFVILPEMQTEELITAVK